MRKERYIVERKGKKGLSLQVFIPFSIDGKRSTFTKTIKVSKFSSPKVAMQYAMQIRDQALADIQAGALRSSMYSVRDLYEKKWDLFPMSINTREKQDTVFRHALEPYANKIISDVTPADIQESLNLYAQFHSSDSVQRLLTVWKQIYKAALFCGLNITDKTNMVTLPKSKVVKAPKDVSISLEDFGNFLKALGSYNAASGRPYINTVTHFMLLIMFYTGCRPAEALALTAADISDDFISINKAVGSTSKKKQVIVPTKTESSKRMIPVAQDLRPILHDLLKWSNHEYLLSDEKGNLYNIDKISGLIRAVSQKCGIPFNAYRLRHLLATDMVKNHVDTRTAQEILGHTSFSMTLSYARSDDDLKGQAIGGRHLK